MARRTGWWVLVLLCALPTAAASSTVEGTLVADGPVTLAPGATLSAEEAGIFLPRIAAVADFSLSAASMRVDAFATRIADVGTTEIVLARDNASAVHSDAVGTWSQARAGWGGIYPAPGAVASVAATAASEIRAAARPTFGNSAPPESTPEPARAGFGPRIGSAAIVAESSGSLVVIGDFALKLYGPALRVSADGGTATYTTGSSREGAERVERHVFVQVTEGRLALRSSEAIELVAETLRATCRGEVGGAFVRGSLRSDTAEYVPSGAAASFEGDLVLAFAPAPGSDSRAIVDVSGEIEPETMGLSRVNLPFAQRASLPWIALAAGGLVVGAGAVLLARRRARPPAFTVDEHTSLANRAAEEGRFGEALEWIRRARAQAPTSARLATDEGFFLAQLGELDAALQAYDRAARLASDGEADLLAARVLLATDAKESAIERAARAIGRSPSLAFDVLDDPVFEEIRGHPRIAPLLREALRE